MKAFYFVIILVSILVISSCELDNNLFNNKKITHYQLPGNTIPDSLIEQVTFNSEGNKLYGYWLKSSGLHPGYTILYCHGNKYNIDNFWDRVMFLYQLGVNIFIFDYRGYGMSEGESSEEGLQADGIAALNFILQKNPDLNVEDSLSIYGYSLGNVVSIYLAAQVVSPQCLIAECAFASANSITQGSLNLDIPPLWLTKGKFDNASMIKNIKCYLLLLHGEEDDFIRWIDNGKIVYENAPADKKLILVPKAKHTDIPQTMGIGAYLDSLRIEMKLK
jgi:pimeloyl-ACP methyl ester carboxylesterase